MRSAWRRSAAIFSLALSYWRDSRRITAARARLGESEAVRRENQILMEGGVRFRKTALRLGGLIIKVGQFLSARSDILPLAFTRELAQLQDQVPEAPWAEVRSLMAAEWGDLLSTEFSHIEEHTLAAASLGQVHYARLQNGREVAIKVQRPGIQELAAIDLRALGVVMRVVQRATRVGRRINAARLFEEFRGLVKRELDYHQEVDHLVRFRSNFQEDPQVVVPDVVPELTRERVFVMEYTPGVKLTDLDELNRLGLSPAHLAGVLVRTYVKQIAVDGLVQIDPHAGNFFADSQGRLILLDFGMVAQLPTQDLDGIITLIQGLLSKNVDVVLVAMENLGFVRPTASRRLLRRAVGFLLDRLSGVALEPGVQMDRAVEDFQDFLYQEPLEFPARYMFLGRAIGMLFGLISQLQPDFEWMTFLRKEALPLFQGRQQGNAPPWIAAVGSWAGSLLGTEVGGSLQTVLDMGWNRLGDAARIPGQLHRVLSLMESGELATAPELTAMTRQIDRLAAISQARLRLLWAGFLAFAAWTAHHLWHGQSWIVWLLALGSLVAALGSALKGRGGRRPRHPA